MKRGRTHEGSYVRSPTLTRIHFTSFTQTLRCGLGVATKLSSGGYIDVVCCKHILCIYSYYKTRIYFPVALSVLAFTYQKDLVCLSPPSTIIQRYSCLVPQSTFHNLPIPHLGSWNAEGETSLPRRWFQGCSFHHIPLSTLAPATIASEL